MTPRVERIQTGVRLEKRLVKVLKGTAEYLDLSLGDLLEGIVLHAFDDRSPFSADTRTKIEQLREVYGLDLRAEDSHRLDESTPSAGPAGPAGRSGPTAPASVAGTGGTEEGGPRGSPGGEA